MSRSFGWTLLTTRSPIEIVPEVMFSRPASRRSKVDLPQPEGTTRTTKAPSSIGIVTPCRASKLPNDLRTSRICTDDIHSLLDPRELRGEFRGSSSYLTRGLTRLFRRCRWIKVVGIRLLRQRCELGGDMQTSAAKSRKCRTITRRVRCGRNHEQTAHRRHQAQTPLQRMVQQPA